MAEKSLTAFEIFVYACK